MSASALRLVDPLLPPPPGGLGTGATLALAAHAALLAALTLSVQWRASTPEFFAAELWSAVPQVAAPPVEVAPPPQAVALPPPRPVEPRAESTQVPDAQIATERQRREKAELAEKAEKAERAERAEREKRDKAARAEQDKRDRAERERREQAERRVAEARTAQELERRRKEYLDRILGQAGGKGAPGSTGTAAVDAAPSVSYVGRLVAEFRRNLVYTGQIAGNPATEVMVRAAPNGTIWSRQVTKPSGVREYDEAVLRAIDRMGTLPRDTDGRVPSTLLITFRPND